MKVFTLSMTNTRFILYQCSIFILRFFTDELIIDPHPISSYNTFMVIVFKYFAGFFRPDHDPPFVCIQ
jgi:hypothetical protein